MVKRFIMISAISGLMFSGTATARLWTSADGRKAFKAEFVKFENGAVYVALESGKEIQFLLSVLSQADQNFVMAEWRRAASRPTPRRATVPQTRDRAPTTGAGITIEPMDLPPLDQNGSVLPPKPQNPAVPVRDDPQFVYSNLQPFLTRFNGNAYVPTRIAPVPNYYLLYFSASWCPECNESLPKFLGNYQRGVLPNPAIEVIHVSQDEDLAQGITWARQNGFRWPTILASDVLASGVGSFTEGRTPTYVMIDGEGQVVATGPVGCVNAIGDIWEAQGVTVNKR